MKKRILTGAVALGAAAALALSGCASNGGDDGGSDGDAKGTIKLTYVDGWTDGQSTAWLLEDQLTKLGYEVEIDTLTDAAVLYAGLANGDIDMYPSAWPQVTHKSYMDEFGDDLEDVGAYYEGAVLTIAVPSYTDIDSIEDLQGKADQFDGKIIGIEPGAGLTKQTQESMMPEYGLDDDYELVTSSTGAMLTELGNAIDEKRDIVVTLWRPFWAYGSYDVKDLEDPKGAMGEPETLNFIGTGDFSERFPDAAELIAGIKLDDQQYADLEDLVVNQHGEGEEREAVDEWIKQNPDAFDTLIAD